MLRRARQILRPPPGLTLRLANGVLIADGAAPANWIIESTRIAPAIGGVLRYDPAGAVNAAIADLAGQLETQPLLFVRGSDALAPGSADVLQSHLTRVRALDELAAATGRRVTLEITGHADSDGPSEANDPLSLRRAERVRAACEGERLDVDHHSYAEASAAASRSARASSKPTSSATAGCRFACGRPPARPAR